MRTKTFLSVIFLTGIFVFTGTELAAQTEEPAETRPVIVSPSPVSELQYFLQARNNSNSNLRLSKRFDSESASSEGSFSVENTATRLSLTIQGSVETGSISVTVILPGGEPIKSIMITNAADVQWSVNISIEEETKNKYHGEWTYKVVANAAKGSYRLSINTY